MELQNFQSMMPDNLSDTYFRIGWEKGKDKQEDGLFNDKRQGFEGFNSLDEASAFINQHNADPDTTSIWFTPNLLDTPQTNKEENVSKIWWMFIDIDHVSPQEIQLKIEDFGLKYGLAPTLIINSGGGVQLYWNLSGKWTSEGWKMIQKRIQNFFGADPNVARAGNLMRVPGTENRKYLLAKKRKEGYVKAYKCEVVSENQNTYSVGSFGVLLQPETKALKRKETAIKKITFAQAEEEAFQKVIKNCPALEKAYMTIKTDQATGTAGHSIRLAVANIIKHTFNNGETFFLKEFSRLSDFNESTSLRHFRSITGGPITCSKHQESGLCTGQCDLMKDIGKQSPIAFKYRSGAGLLTNDELLKDVDDESKFEELMKRARLTSNPLRRQKLIERISTESGLKESALKQEIKNVIVVNEQKPFVLNGKIHEVKAAEFIINKYKLIRYQEDFYQYEDGIWKLMSKEEMEAIIHNEIKKWSDNHTISETINAVRRECFLSQKVVEENTGTYVISCNNGLLDVRDNSFRDFTEKDYRFQKMIASYDPNAKAQEFLGVLDELFDGDVDKNNKISMLQEIMGYLLIPDYTLIKKMFYLWGPKANNGKSTVLDIIQAVMGEAYIDSVPLNKLDGFMLKRLAGIHANIVGDQDAAVKVPDGVIKQLVGGRDRITADVKNKEAINFKNHARLIFAVNKLPFSQAKDAGYYTRVAVLVFNNEFVPDPEGKQKKADPLKIDRIIENELDGILNWMLEGLQRLLQTKQLTIPVSSIEALDEYKTENNSVLQFVQDKCDLGAAEKILRSKLYENYSQWALDNGFKHKTSASTFFKTLESEFDITQHKSDGSRYLIGIGQVWYA